MSNRFVKKVTQKASPLQIALASLALAVVCCAAAAHARTADEFTLVAPAGMTAAPTSSRQFDTSFGVNTQDGSIPNAGTSRHVCEIGFKFNSANNHLTQAEINTVTSQPQWRTSMRDALANSPFGTIFELNSVRAASVQGYKGVEFALTPKLGPGAADIRGLMTMVETPKGRMTSVCITTAPAFVKAEQRFRALLRNAHLPE